VRQPRRHNYQIPPTPPPTHPQHLRLVPTRRLPPKQEKFGRPTRRSRSKRLHQSESRSREGRRKRARQPPASPGTSGVEHTSAKSIGASSWASCGILASVSPWCLPGVSWCLPVSPGVIGASSFPPGANFQNTRTPRGTLWIYPRINPIPNNHFLTFFEMQKTPGAANPT